MKLCQSCGKQLNARNVSGFCQVCNRTHPDAVAKRVAGYKLALKARPELVQSRIECLRKIHHTDAHRERARKMAKKWRIWELGHAALGPAGSEARMRGARTQSNSLLAWCPPHLRTEYRRLIQRKFGQEEARRIILEQEAKERHRLRVKMGVADPDCEFNLEPYGPPCPDHLKPLMAASKAFRIPVGDIVRGTRSDRHVSRAKQAVMLALRKQGLSFLKIAPILNLKDHSTVIYGVKQAEYLASNDAGFARALAKVVAA